MSITTEIKPQSLTFMD